MGRYLDLIAAFKRQQGCDRDESDQRVIEAPSSAEILEFPRKPACDQSPITAATEVAARHVFADFETVNRGGCDLQKSGAWRYAEHPATRIESLAYRLLGSENAQIWHPDYGLDAVLADLAADPDVLFVRFGDFERAVWEKIMVERYDYPELPAARWLDSRAVCCSLALPRAVESALAVLGTGIAKDKEGQKLMLSLAKPNKRGIYPEITDEVQQRIFSYDKADAAAARA
jgi:hypothetical protein